MPPKQRPQPERWSLEQAKKDQAGKRDFDPNPPKLGQTPRQQQRSQDGKFAGKDKAK